MRIKMLLMAVVLAGLIFSLSASAQTGCPDPKETDPVCFEVPMTVASGQQYNGLIPKFDSSLGTLTSVKLTTRACAASTYKLDSEDPFVQIWTVIMQGNVIVTPPVGPSISVFAGTPDEGIEVITQPDDEPGLLNADFAGPDYFELITGTVDNPICNEDESTYDSPAELAVFNGNSGETLPVQIRLRANKDIRNDNGSTYEEKAAVLASGEVCVRYTYQPPCPKFCINGTKINDCTDEGLAGWTINLKDASGTVIATTTTDSNGEYSFCGLAPGSYTVCEVMKPDWKNVGPTCIPVNLVDVDFDFADFRNTPALCISGYKFNNATGEGLAGWTINLKDATGAVKATATTGADGSYKFCGLFSGSYTVCEVMKAGWKSVGDICKPVTLVNCEDATDVDFRNDKVITGCDTRCPWHIVNELYKASCGVPLEVPAKSGILANDRVGAVVINPESITIDPKYGTLSVEYDGSFVYDPALNIASGTYVTFKYSATNGVCDALGQGLAKIQVYCKR